MSELTFGQKLSLLSVFVLGTVLATGSWMAKKVESQAQAIESGRQEIQAEHEKLLNHARSHAAETAQSLIETSNDITQGHLNLMKEHRKARDKFEQSFRKGL